MTSKVYDALSHQPKTRAELVTETGLPDRRVRKEIEDLRQRGVPICSSSHGRGYWIGSEQEKEQTVKELRARAFRLLKTADAMERYDPAQLRMDI